MSGINGVVSALENKPETVEAKPAEEKAEEPAKEEVKAEEKPAEEEKATN